MSFNSTFIYSNNIKEYKLSLQFSKFFIPYIQLNEFVFDLLYDNKTFRFNYPQSNPFILESFYLLKKGNNKISLTILFPSGEKYYKLGKGEIQIYKEDLDYKYSFHKMINFILYKEQFKLMGIDIQKFKNEKPVGQILVDGKLDKIIDKSPNKKKLNYISLKKKSEHNLKNIDEYFEKIIFNNKKKDLLKQNKEKEKENNILNTSFKNLSLISNKSNNDEKEDEINIEKLFTDINLILSNLQDLQENKNIPDDIELQRKLYFKLLKEKENITQLYNETIKNISESNKKLKEKTKKLFTDYLQKKEEYKKNKKEIKEQLIYSYNKSNEIKQNNKSNKEIFQKIKENEKNIENKLNNNSILDINDINAMIDILNILKKCPNNISEKLDKNEKEELEKILNKRPINHKLEMQNNENFLKKESEKIIIEIERITNKNFNDNIIRQMEIIQISNNEYLFDNIKLVLFFKNNELITNDNENFESWLIRNFKITNK